jgi:glycosyltransferase involved in cell wall biosynthesis
MTARSRWVLDEAEQGVSDDPFSAVDLVRAVGHQLIGRPPPRAIQRKRWLLGGNRRNETPNAAYSRQKIPAQMPGGHATFYRNPARICGSDISADDVVLLTDLSPLTNASWHSQSLVERVEVAIEAIIATRPLVIVTGRFAAEALCANYGFPRENIAIAPSYSNAAKEAPSLGARNGRDILAVGSEHVRDNLISVIEAFEFSGLARQKTTLRLLVRVIDEAPSSLVAEARALLRYVASTTAGVRLEYIERAPGSAAYASAAVLIYVPYLDGVGAPLITAMTAGVPVVTSLTGVCAEIAGPYGACVDPDDPETIATALLKALSAEDDERQRYQQDCSRWIGDHYSFDAFESAMRAALSPALGRSSINAD